MCAYLTRIFYFVALLLCDSTLAQLYTYADSLTIIAGNKVLDNPSTGGINSGQFSNFDLNGDGIKDILVFEKSSEIFMPFLVHKTGNSVRYQYAPTYAYLFPKSQYFALFRDYDGDGNEDLFTYSTLGIKVYRCVRTSNDISFELVKDPIESDYLGIKSNILINSYDLPIIQDMDGDGDLDIVNFNAFSGEQLEFHKNMSQELFGNNTAFVYKQTDECYGKFKEVSCDKYTFHLDCRLQRKAPKSARAQHVGYGALLAFDADFDNKEDLLICKVDCPSINYLKNTGSNSQRTYEQLLSKFSKEDTFNLAGFPNAFAIDIDGNNTKELIVAPGSTSSGFSFNYEASCHLFDPTLKQSNPAFLQDQTIELGENTSPLLFDYDHDQDLDLFIGYHTFKANGKYRGGIALYENVLSDQEPIYTLRHLDYMHLLDKQWVNVSPAFIDIDADGFEDLLVTAADPRNQLNTYTFSFKGIANGSFSTQYDTLALTLNYLDLPLFVKKNNTIKALVGRSNGRLTEYTKADNQWLLQKDTLGFLPEPGATTLVVCEANVDGDDEEDLLLCSAEKYILYVRNYQEQDKANWSIDTLKYLGALDKAEHSVVLSRRSVLFSRFIPYLKSDIWVGNLAGGIHLLKASNEQPKAKPNFVIYPNPFYDELIIHTSLSDAYTLYDLAGKLLLRGELSKGYNMLTLPHIKAGIYLIKTGSSTQLLLKK